MLSASKVGLAAHCTAAFVLPHTEENHAGQDEGSERHEELEADVQAGWIPPQLLERWPDSVWLSEVAFAYDAVSGAAQSLGVGINRAYGDLLPHMIPGTADLIGRHGSRLIIGERKSHDPTIERAAKNAQLHALAVMACRTYGEDSCTIFLWHEDRQLDVMDVDALDLAQYAAELRLVQQRVEEAQAIGRIDPKPGSWCRYCPAFQHCPAQKALVRQVGNGELALQIESLVPMRTPEEATRAYGILEDLKMLTKRVSGIVFAYGAQTPIQLGDGKVFGAREKEGNDKLDGEIVYAVVREAFGQEKADAAVTRSATKKRLKETLG
ncbi:MAG TPA: PD-(D/E)XK nuclease family protein, partial [Casimicrobiaceae bacterium]